MQSDLKHYTEANRVAWNEVMPLHQRAAKDTLDELFSRPGFVALQETEIELLQRVGIKGKNVVHLCCNNGVELLSLKNLGSADCLGFDISDEAIKEARERTAKSHIECQFIRSDVYDIGAEHNNQFDIAYISGGGLGWLPDLQLFFAKAASLLRNDGHIFIHEVHPFSDLLPLVGSKEEGSMRVVGPYFKTEPYIEQGGLDYVGNSEYAATTTNYWFVHTLSSILMSLISNGILVEHFSESETALSPNHRHIEEADAGIPLSYFLIGRKKNSS